jgi:hypothetical protein
MSESSKVSSFGQVDPTDNRQVGDWRSKYTDPEAKRAIRFEAWYLALHLAFVPPLMLLLWLEYPKTWLHLTDEKYSIIVRYGLAWLAGVLGGTLYDAKWLYHTVARQLWHLDRQIWRLFTPHISGGLAFAVVILIASGLLRILDPHAVDSCTKTIGMGFLVGYFSDSAIAKLAEIAETLFGPSRSKEKHGSEVKHKDKEKPKDIPSTAESESKAEE